MSSSRLSTPALAFLLVFVCVLPAAAQQPVTIHVEIAAAPESTGKKGPDYSNVAVWLDPLDVQPPALSVSTAPVAAIVQKNKMFEPHMTVVRTGSYIAFPNQDPFFHNVFSLYNGKRFDLGLYESGTSKKLLFDRPGVSYLFCNIHEQMSAVVIAVDTPYSGVTDRTGQVELPAVPDGRYTLHVFYERSTAEQLKSLDRTITIAPASRSIDGVRVPTSHDVTLAHKNKYGEDYVPPPASGYNP